MKTCPQCQIKYPEVLEFCPRDGAPLPAAAGSKDATQDPLLDTTIDGRYAIESRLGEGGMGVVYKARHVLIDKPVAIKILRKEAAQDTASVQRFIQEAKSASKINHSNIVDITDFGVLSDGHAYFVMEFLQGHTLAQVIQEGPLDPLRVCSIAGQVARGLHAAHTKGIVHRDLKPENIFLLEREGQKDYVKIVDFGIAKVGSGQKLTQVGMVLGTPEYMSPEQATGQETDHRVDQYALGCIMYEMLTGVVPFLSERPAQTLTKHVFEPVLSPRKRKPELKIPASVDAVVMRTLAKKPEQRFPSMRELEQALSKIETDAKGGRVVIDDTTLAPSSISGGGQPPAVVPPGPGYAPPGSTPPGYGTPALPAAFYSPLPTGTPNQSVPQAVPMMAPGAYPSPMAPPFSSGAHQATMGAMRPTREGQHVKARRGRMIFAAVACGLVVLIGLLGYFISTSSTSTSRQTQNPNPLVATPVEPPPRVDTPPQQQPPVVELAPVELQVVSQPPGAEVYIDGNLAEKTPYKFSSKRGVKVRIEVRKRGFEPFYKELEPDSDRTLDIKLEKSGHTGRNRNGDGAKKVEKAPAGPAQKSDPKSTNKPGAGTLSRDGGSKSGLPTGLRDPFRRTK